MAKKVEPGVICRVIGSALGNGPSIGRIVQAQSKYAHEHTVWGPIWRCTAADGKDLVTEHGGVGQNADFAEDWLEVLEDDELQKDTTTELEKVEE